MEARSGARIAWPDMRIVLFIMMDTMFGGSVFDSWPLAALGAAFFASLFLVIMTLMEAVIGSGAQVTRAGIGVTAAAFFGYLGTVFFIWWRDAHPDNDAP